jgi:hypothetical protein
LEQFWTSIFCRAAEGLEQPRVAQSRKMHSMVTRVLFRKRKALGAARNQQPAVGKNACPVQNAPVIGASIFLIVKVSQSNNWA